MACCSGVESRPPSRIPRMDLSPGPCAFSFPSHHRKTGIATVRIVRGAHLPHGFDYRGRFTPRHEAMHAFLAHLGQTLALPALLLAGNVMAATPPFAAVHHDRHFQRPLRCCFCLIWMFAGCLQKEARGDAFGILMYSFNFFINNNNCIF